MMQRRQWDLAHDEEDHLGALIRGQRAGKGACRKETRLAQVGLPAARVSAPPLNWTNYRPECGLRP